MHKSLLYLLLFFCGAVANAQHLPIKQYTIHDGLAQMQVMATLEDSRGYVWAATKGGLSKFDGERFENFYKKDGLYQYNIMDLFEDSKSNIWVCYARKGFGKFDGKSFKNYTFNTSNLSTITEFNKKMVFFKNDSLFSISKESFLYEGVVLNGVETNRIFTDPQSGNLFVMAKGQVYYLEPNTREFKKLQHKETVSLDLFVSGGRLFLNEGGKKSKLFLVEENTKKLCVAIEKGASKIHFNPGVDFSLHNRSDGFWVYHSKTNNLAYFDKLVGAYSTSQTKGGKQKMYVGSEKGLVCVYLNGITYFTQEEVPYAWGVAEDAKKNIWISNYGSPIQMYNGAKIKTVRDYTNVIEKRCREVFKLRHVTYGNNWYYSPVKDKFDKLWFADFQGVLIKKREKYDYLTEGKGDFFYITEDPKRDRIIGCGMGGLTLIDSRNPKKFMRVTDTSATFHPSRIILTAAVDSAGDYWLGGRHIVKYSPDKGTFKYYADYNKKIPAVGAGRLHFDSYGGLWVGTFLEGLWKYNGKEDKFEMVFEKYFKDKTTHFNGQISEKYFLASDGLNIFIIDLEAYYKEGKEKVVKVLSHHNGFLGIEPGQNGFFKDSQGRIWICSGTVLSLLNLEQLSLKPSPLYTYIRKINGNRLPFSYSNLAPIEIEAGKNDVKVEVESVGEDKGTTTEFSYRIPGFKEEWSDWQTDNAIYLTNLPAGTYKIEVRSKHGLLEEDNHPTTSVSFVVSVPIHKSPVFYKYAYTAFGILLAILALIGIQSYLENRKFRKQKQRTEDLDRKLKLLQIQTTQAQLNPHFIFNVLQSLQSQILQKNTESAAENVVKLSHLIRSFLNSSVSGENSSLSAMEISLESEIELLKSYIDFEKEQKDNFDYEIIEKPPLNAVNYRIQPLLIQPFVENAIKHGFQDMDKRGQLTILFEAENEEVLICTIVDNGIGMEASREIQKRSIRKYKSLGTKVVNKRIESLNEIGYNISVNILSQNGTTVIIRIDYNGKD